LTKKQKENFCQILSIMSEEKRRLLFVT